MNPGHRIELVRNRLISKFQNAIDNYSQHKWLLEIKDKSHRKPNWALALDQSGNPQHLKGDRGKKSPAGSYRRVLNRNKAIGCLFSESKSIKGGSDKTETKFQIIGRRQELYGKNPKKKRRSIKPIIKYDSSCLLCKSNLVVPRTKGKLWRKNAWIDTGLKELGTMITCNKNDFSVHQLCMDYAHGDKMVQNYKPEKGIQKLDGYNIENIKNLRGSACKFCKKSKGVTACWEKKCKAFYHLPCGINHGSVQIRGHRRSFCPNHAHKAGEEPQSTNEEEFKHKKNTRKRIKVEIIPTPPCSQELLNMSHQGSMPLGISAIEDNIILPASGTGLENIDVVWAEHLADPEPIDYKEIEENGANEEKNIFLEVSFKRRNSSMSSRTGFEENADESNFFSSEESDIEEELEIRRRKLSKKPRLSSEIDIKEHPLPSTSSFDDAGQFIEKMAANHQIVAASPTSTSFLNHEQENQQGEEVVNDAAFQELQDYSKNLQAKLQECEAKKAEQSLEILSLKHENSKLQKQLRAAEEREKRAKEESQDMRIFLQNLHEGTSKFI